MFNFNLIQHKTNQVATGIRQIQPSGDNYQNNLPVTSMKNTWKILPRIIELHL